MSCAVHQPPLSQPLTNAPPLPRFFPSILRTRFKWPTRPPLRPRTPSVTISAPSPPRPSPRSRSRTPLRREARDRAAHDEIPANPSSLVLAPPRNAPSLALEIKSTTTTTTWPLPLSSSSGMLARHVFVRRDSSLIPQQHHLRTADFRSQHLRPLLLGSVSALPVQPHVVGRLTYGCSCRKRDSHKSSEYPLFQTDLSPPPSPQRSFDLDHQHPVDVVPQRSPTSFPSPITSRRTSTVHASSDDDLDSDVRDQSRNTSSASLASSVFASRPSMGRHDSEAGSYLQQYYSTSRPIVARNPSHTPSLSHTPTSTSGTSVPFTPVSTGASSTRQAPFRSWSRPGSMHFSSKSVDLVTPITIEQQKSVDVPSSMSTTVASDDTIRMDLEQLSLHPDPESTGRSVSGESLPYPKSSTVGTLQSPASSSLKALFQFEQMRSAPSRG